MVQPKLSICIPTCNRLNDLKTCLGWLLPQVAAAPAGQVEVVIVDNASSDGTPEYLDGLPGQYPFVRVFHNPRNLGFDGNTARCIECANGEYTALLSDDDFYLDGQVENILRVLAERDYALVRLNYHTFLEDARRPYQTFQPERDVFFPRAADLLNFFHGGHFSGIIYRSELAKATLAHMLARAPLDGQERARGVYVELELRIAKSSELPAYFIGRRLLATSIPRALNYAALENICLDHMRFHARLLAEGVITPAEYERNKQITLKRLPQMIVTFTPGMSRAEIVRVTQGLRQYLGDAWRFRLICVPLLFIGQLAPGKALYALARRLGRLIKRGIVYRTGLLVRR